MRPQSHHARPARLTKRTGALQGTCVLNAEERFLPHLFEINRKFPKLRIVLEHCTTAAAVEAVSRSPALLLLRPCPA